MNTVLSGFNTTTPETIREMATIDAAALRTEPDYTAAITRLQDPGTARLLHAAIGMATEAGEFLDMLKKHIYYGKPIDRVNAIEEMGDASWYQRIGCNALEASFLDMLLRNVRKLQKRYPEKFTEEAAINRDTDAERVILEKVPTGPDGHYRREVGNCRLCKQPVSSGMAWTRDKEGLVHTRCLEAAKGDPRWPDNTRKDHSTMCAYVVGLGNCNCVEYTNQGGQKVWAVHMDERYKSLPQGFK